MYVCANCRTGDFFEEEEVLVPELQPHGELLHYEECPRCANRDRLIPLDGNGKKQLRAYAKNYPNPDVREWAIEVLYDLATEQVTT